MGSEARRVLNRPYLGKEAAAAGGSVLAAMHRLQPLADLYLITLASNGVDQLDILSSQFLRQKRVRDTLPLIVGAAFGREEALRTVEQMAADAFRETGACDLKAFLLRRDEE